MNELFDLFSSVETNTNSKPKENVYSGIIEARVRPNNEPFAEKTSVDQMTNDALELEIEKGEEMSMPTTPENHTVTEEPKAYSTEKILEAATEYFKGDSLAASVWMNKYALKDSYGKVYELTPADMHRRLAKELPVWKKNIQTHSPKKRYSAYSKDSNTSFPKAAPWQASAMISKSLPFRTVLSSATMAPATHTAES